MKKVLKIAGIVAIICAGAAAVFAIVKAIIGFRATSDYINYKEGYFDEEDDLFLV